MRHSTADVVQEQEESVTMAVSNAVVDDLLEVIVPAALEGDGEPPPAVAELEEGQAAVADVSLQQVLHCLEAEVLHEMGQSIMAEVNAGDSRGEQADLPLSERACAYQSSSEDDQCTGNGDHGGSLEGAEQSVSSVEAMSAGEGGVLLKPDGLELRM